MDFGIQGWAFTLTCIACVAVGHSVRSAFDYLESFTDRLVDLVHQKKITPSEADSIRAELRRVAEAQDFILKVIQDLTPQKQKPSPNKSSGNFH